MGLTDTHTNMMVSALHLLLQKYSGVTQHVLNGKLLRHVLFVLGYCSIDYFHAVKQCCDDVMFLHPEVNSATSKELELAC